MMLLAEKISYFFFKNRLRKKLSSLYALEDPWHSRDLRESFLPLIREALQSRSPDACQLPALDAGGGEGWFYDPLADLIHSYHLLDINSEALARARERITNGSSRFIESSLDQFHPSPHTYGSIWLFSVLAYLGADRHPNLVRRCLKNLWRSLSPGGCFILLLPYYSPSEKNKQLQMGQFFSALPGSKLILERDFAGSAQSFLFQAYSKSC